MTFGLRVMLSFHFTASENFGADWEITVAGAFRRRGRAASASKSQKHASERRPWMGQRGLGNDADEVTASSVQLHRDLAEIHFAMPKGPKSHPKEEIRRVGEPRKLRYQRADGEGFQIGFHQ